MFCVRISPSQFTRILPSRLPFRVGYQRFVATLNNGVNSNGRVFRSSPPTGPNLMLRHALLSIPPLCSAQAASRRHHLSPQSSSSGAISQLAQFLLTHVLCGDDFGGIYRQRDLTPFARSRTRHRAVCVAIILHSFCAPPLHLAAIVKMIGISLFQRTCWYTSCFANYARYCQNRKTGPQTVFLTFHKKC